jgi:hypothetical protein
MSLVINTNLASQNAQRQLMRSGVSLDLATQIIQFLKSVPCDSAINLFCESSLA